MTRIITGLFERRGDAERAVERLVQELGINPRGVEVYATGSAKLGRLLSPEDHPAYGAGLRRQGIAVSAEVEEDHLDQALAAWKACGAVSSSGEVTHGPVAARSRDPPNPPPPADSTDSYVGSRHRTGRMARLRRKLLKCGWNSRVSVAGMPLSQMNSSSFGPMGP